MLIPVLIFVFLLGCCIGSFLNVVVYRLPLGKSLIHPPSTCPKCNTRLAWHDNIPVLGWLWLGGKCRTCKLPISVRYPIVEAACGLLFLGYSLAIFKWGWGPCLPAGMVGPIVDEFGLPVGRLLPDIGQDWMILAIHLPLLAVLLTASLIDLETFTIPISLPITAAVVGLLGHAFLMSPGSLGNLRVSPELALPAAFAVGGYVVTLVAFWLKWVPLSFPQGEPMMLDHAEWQAEIDAAKAEGREPNVPLEPPVRWTRGMLNREMGKELLFMGTAIAGFAMGFVANKFFPGWGPKLAGTPYLSGFLGSALGGLVGGFVIWMVRILGTFGFGKLAMGLGDVHLMAGVGCCVGGMVAGLALFAGAVWGLVFTLYAFLLRSRREVPFGPYLAMGTLTCMLAACYLEGTLMEILHGPPAPQAPAIFDAGGVSSGP